MLVSMTVNINSDANPAPRPARCNFCVRYPAPGGKWTFVAIRLANWWSNGAIPLWMPPSVGDLITLHPAHGQELEGGPVYRVVDRMWVTAVYGSGSWPLGKAAPVEGPLMEIIVEPAPGLYADQAPSGDDD
ncbi:MAG: hypothetical protein JWM19_952 [Actinomycetia bacterium]|nr:hypothetical protein [Actinomycetes bacterium]